MVRLHTVMKLRLSHALSATLLGLGVPLFAADPESKVTPVAVSTSPVKTSDKAKTERSGWPSIDEVTAAMRKAAAVMRRDVAFAGGYAWRWPVDLSIAHGENRSSPSLIMIQPPGTPAMGLALLQAYEATGDVLFLQGAREAASALLWCQMATGGWGSDFDFDPRSARKYHFRRDILAGDTVPAGRHGDSTLDDQKTQSALLFLLELSHCEACKDDKELRAALKFGFDGLLAAQSPNGGWPQHYRGPADPAAPVKKPVLPNPWPRVWPNVDYTGFYTLNDNNIKVTILLLLRAYELEKDERFLTAAKKAGDFLLLARLPDPHPVWAQQYNADMEPVWARKFEPPAACSVESLGALSALHELWISTGDSRYLEPMKPALAWLDKVRLGDGRWARFYELGTNRPLYCKAETYEVTFDDTDLPTHYGFKTESSFERNLAKLKEALGKDRAQLLGKRADPDTPRRWTSRAKGEVDEVKAALRTQDKKGWWLKKDQIDAGLFVQYFEAMAKYVKSARLGGDDFITQQRDSMKADAPAK